MVRSLPRKGPEPRRDDAAQAPHDRRIRITSRATPPSLQKLLDDGVIDAVVCPLKSGKEADLFVVEREPYHYVAKVYKERKYRSFKNDAGYKEGRGIRNTRAQRALSKNTRFGKKLAEKSWHNAEVDALRKLELAGARVPRVLAHHGNILIMEMICDSQGQLAPQLAQVPLSAEGAMEVYESIIEQVVIMLLNDLIHGDLSPYNVLVRDDGPVIIDMPQCVSAAHNKQAQKLLERDVYAITRHLGLINPKIKPLGKAAWQLWFEYEAGTLVREFRPDPARERDNEINDLGGLVDFVKTAAEEGDLERRAAEGDTDAQALLRAADRREAKRARRIAQAAAEAELEAKEAEEKAARRTRKGDQRANNKKRGGGGGGGGGRRRKRSRGGGGDGPKKDQDRPAKADRGGKTSKRVPKAQASKADKGSGSADGETRPRRRRRGRGKKRSAKPSSG